MLYKAECMMSMKDSHASAIRDLLGRAEAILPKFDLGNDKNLQDSFKAKYRLLALMEAQLLEVTHA